jgi:hypothetical protein
VERLDDNHKSENAANQKVEESENATVQEEKQEKPQTPPPIATFEEWTKEKLLSKEKKPPLKEVQQQTGSGNGAPAVDQKPPTSNGQSSGAGSGATQEQTGKYLSKFFEI